MCVRLHVVKYGWVMESNQIKEWCGGCGAHTHEKRMRWPKVPYILQPLLG